MDEYPPAKIARSRFSAAQRGRWWYIGSLAVVVLGAIVLVFALRRDPDINRESLQRKSPKFEELTSARQKQVLEDPQFWFLRFERAVAQGQLPIKQGARLARTQNGWHILDVHNHEVNAAAQWVSRNVPASDAPISLEISVVLATADGTTPQRQVVDGRDFTIDVNSVSEVIPRDENPLRRKMFQAIDAGKLRIEGYPKIEAAEDQNLILIYYVAEPDVLPLATWLHAEIPVSSMPVRLRFNTKPERFFSVTPNEVSEVKGF